MDKQQSDHIDNIIRQAAENVSVPFKEEAWEKMELLLDKDLQKDRRPAVIWWWTLLLLCILCGSAYYYFFDRDPAKEQATPAVTRGETPVQQGGLANARETGTDEDPAGTANEVAVSRRNRAINTIPEAATSTAQQPESKAIVPHHANNTVPEAGSVTGTSVETSRLRKDPVSGAGNGKSFGARTPAPHSRRRPVYGSMQQYKPPVNSNTRSTGVQEESAQGKPAADQQAVAQAGAPVAKQDDPVKSDSSSPAAKSIAATDTAATIITRQKAQVVLSRAKQTTGLYYLAAVARNATDVKTLTLNNLDYIFGAGVGYQLNYRLRIQTGFYAGRKIYKAGPGDYRTKEGSLYNVSLKSVNADCYIIDIPFSVRYDVVHKRTFNIYGTVGLSSFIMKKENYIYHYNDVYGRYGMLDSTYRGNANFLTGVNVAVGVEKMIVKGLYVQAEPYIKVPLSGIGEGKVRLYDAGIQLGLRYQPLRTKKAH